MSFAFGIALCVARSGSSISGIILPRIVDKYMAMNPPEPYKGVAYGLFLGFFICLISLVFAFLLACIDAYADRVENKKAIALTEEEKFKLADLKKFERPYWLLSASCVLCYCVIFPYISNLSNMMLQDKYAFSNTEAGFYYTLPYNISLFACIPMGLLIDLVGRKVLFSK